MGSWFAYHDASSNGWLLFLKKTKVAVADKKQFHLYNQVSLKFTKISIFYNIFRILGMLLNCVPFLYTCGSETNFLLFGGLMFRLHDF